MNIKDSYLHGGTHVVKNVEFSIANSGNNNGKLVATITWAQEGADATLVAIPISGATFGSLTKNTVFAAPSDAAGNPSFRTLVAADIPELSAGKITSGTLGAARLPLATNEAKGAVILGVAADNTTNITGKLYWVKMNANGKIYVDVPWDTNTHYTAVPVLGGSTATSNATSDTANDATYLNIVENSAKSGGVQIIGAGGASVKANAGKLTITSTWRAANSTLNGYVPQLANGGASLADSTNDYVLAFTYAASGTLTPTWKKLPANAYLNNTYTVNDGTYSIKSKIGDTVTTLSDFTANQSTADDFTLIQGNNITFTNDATNKTLTIAANSANSSLSGVVPKLVNGGDELADSTNDYVLAFVYSSSGTLTPSWKKLPAKAYQNTWRGIQDNLTSSTNTTESLSAKQGYLLANGSARDNTKLPLAGGTMTGAIKRLYSAASDDPMIALTSNNFDIWLWRINSGASTSTSTSTDTSLKAGFGLKYLGTGSNVENNLVLYADNLQSGGSYGTLIAAITINQAGLVKFDTTPQVGSTNVSLVGHKHAYTDLTGSTTTADQAIVSNGTANGWTLKTLGSRAFDSTAYVPVAGNVTMTGPLNMGNASNATNNTDLGINFGSVGRIGVSSGIGMYCTGDIWIRPKCTLTNGAFSTNYGLAITNTTFTYNGNTIYHSGNIPSNTKDAAGIVAKGVASRVYMTDDTGAPAWREYDTTVTESSGKLITSGGVYTAIANSVAGAVQYLGTVASEAAMIALAGAGQGDFARVITEFSFTDATGASVTAHVGDVVYLTNNTPGTSSNWIVAHTEIDTNTWTAASTSAAGYVPKLVTGGAALAASSTDYVLAFTNGATSPSWLKLPASAYSNTTGIKLKTDSGAPGTTKKTDNTLISAGSSTGLQIQGGTNKFLIGNGTNYIEVPITISITDNVTGSGTSGRLAKWNGANTITDGPALSTAVSSQTQSTKFLREDGTWAAPSYTTNTDKTAIKKGTAGATDTSDDTLISANSSAGIIFEGGTNQFKVGDGTNSVIISVEHGLSTQNININGTDYAIYTSAGSLPTIKAPTGYGSANLILATNADGNGFAWVTKPTSNVTTSLYIGASDGTSTAAQSSNGNVHLILKEGSSYTRYKITGSGRATVTSDASGTITINSAGYSAFVKSGSTAAAGLVPAPSTTAGTTKFLCEDGTWKLPSYTTNTDENVKQSGSTTASYRGIVLGKNSNATANTGIADTVTGQVYTTNNLVVQPSTGNVVSLGSGTFAGLICTTNGITFRGAAADSPILWKNSNGSVEQRMIITDDSTADTAVFTFQQSSDTGSTWSNLMTIKDNGKVVATTFVGALSGNASTASNLSKTDGRGYLYQSANTTTGYTGVGSVSAATEIGIPYIGYSGSANTYGIYKDLFYLSGTTKYIHGDVHSTKFACVKTQNSTTDDWDGSTTSGESTSGGTTYSAGDGITISGTTISTSNKEWYGTEAQFNALTSLNSNTTYYITAD